MVNVGPKDVTVREAVARGRVFMHRKTLALIRGNRAKKDRFDRARGSAEIKWRTEDLMALLRGE